jgi:NADPH-dependent curcumin reductase CurA
MRPAKNREIHLVSRPIGMPKNTDFALVETDIPPLKEGEILIKNHYISVDPYMRGRMYDRKSYVPPFELNQPMTGGNVGEILESTNPGFQEGEYVSGMGGWREYFISNGSGLTIIDPKAVPIHNYLSLFGMTGLTAYIGLIEIAQVRKRDTVFISAAAGAVGSIACQIAKEIGCKVIGSAGSDEKVKWLVEDLGIDAAFNYKKVENIQWDLANLAPKGIGVYFDNVGGKTLDAALANIKKKGRVAVCGMISQYNKAVPDPIYNLLFVNKMRLKIEGFIVSDHMGKTPEFIDQMSKWYAEGKIKQRETVVEGIENAVDAFLGLFSGENIGKMLVKLQ